MHTALNRANWMANPELLGKATNVNSTQDYTPYVQVAPWGHQEGELFNEYVNNPYNMALGASETPYYPAPQLDTFSSTIINNPLADARANDGPTNVFQSANYFGSSDAGDLFSGHK